MRLYLATMDTRHFAFDVIDRSRKAATEGLLQGLREHGRQYQLDENWWVGHFDIEVREMLSGAAYRDRSLVFSGK